MKLLAWVFPAILLASAAEAHPLDIAYVQVRASSDRLDVSLQLNPAAAEKFAGLNKSIFSWEEKEKIFFATLGNSTWSYGGRVCAWISHEVASGESGQDQSLRITAQSSCGGGATNRDELAIDLNFLRQAEASYKALGRVEKDGAPQRTFLTDQANPSAIVSLHEEHGFLQFVALGVEHIGAVPSQWHGPEGWRWPDGIDHILFVVALLLGGGTALQLVKTVSGFTIGHSITLALSALNIVYLPTKLVEILIALSIVYVAAEASLLRRSGHRWQVACAFGIFHGFGFASALRELSLSRGNLLEAIIGFNLGVEFGQLVVIACFLPILFFMKRCSARYYLLTLRVGGAAIALAGSYWVVERIIS